MFHESGLLWAKDEINESRDMEIERYLHDNYFVECDWLLW